jgi:(R,R)-butanediol dehydrogenase / meso-butanediol dehydrogenase / diacetyl reductase
MRAARYHGVGDVRIEEVAEPLPTDGEVQIEVAYNGLCGTDLHEVYDGPRAVPLQPHPLTGVRLPVILGHEAAGVVTRTGAGVTGLVEGDMVVIEPTRACGRCPECRSGRYNLCDILAFHGYSTDGGGLAEYTVIPQAMAHLVPAGMTAEQAAVVEPLAVAHHAIRRWDIRPGATALVMGGGPIGIGIVLGLRAVGIDEVIVVEPAADRRAVAEAFGAGVIDPTGDDVAAQVRALTAGRGVTVAFETAGAATSFTSAVASTAKEGTVVVVASGRHAVIAPLGLLLASEITIRTSYAYCRDFPEVIALMTEGAYPLDGWVSTIPLDDLLAGFERLRRGEAIKLLVDPRPR